MEAMHLCPCLNELVWPHTHFNVTTIIRFAQYKCLFALCGPTMHEYVVAHALLPAFRIIWQSWEEGLGIRALTCMYESNYTMCCFFRQFITPRSCTRGKVIGSYVCRCCCQHEICLISRSMNLRGL